jgi:hypothetical protein
VSHETEQNGSLPFLDVLLTRRHDGTLSRSIYRKATWKAQYLHFTSFAPVMYKRGLVKPLFDRARKICTVDQLPKEQQLIKDSLILNGYPEKSIEVHCKATPSKVPAITVDKKEVILTLPFRGDHLANDIRQKLRSALERTYFAARLRLVQTTNGINFQNRSQNISGQPVSHVVYQFTCSCGDTYIGRTDRYLLERMAEHIPKYLVRIMATQGTTKTENRNPASSIAKHLLAKGHVVDPEHSFKVLVRCRNPRLLAFYEAILIKRHDPILCAQKQLKQTLCLPWT